MEPERITEKDVERLRNMRRKRPGNVSNLARLHQSRAALYARTDENWLSLAATTSFEVEPRAEGSSRQTQTGHAREAQQAALTNESDPTMEPIHGPSGPIPRTMRGHRRTSAISKPSSSRINRSMGNLVSRPTRQLYFPDRAVPEHDPVAEPLPGFGLAWDLFPPRHLPPSYIQEMEIEGMPTQGKQQEQEQQGRQEQPSQFLFGRVSDLTAGLQPTSTSSGSQGEDKNGLVGSLKKMDIQ